jgi:multiple sugar transport system permease protein
MEEEHVATKSVSSARRRPSGVMLREWRDGWLFALPFLLGFLLWTAGPMLYSIYLVFQDWDMLTPPQFVGFDNLVQLTIDPLVQVSLVNTAFFTFIGVPLQVVVAVLLALALNVKLRGINVYRTVFYLPAIVPAVASAVVWTQIFNPDFGVVNNILLGLGLPTHKWLLDPGLAKPAFIFMGLWAIGPQMVIALAGLQNVPEVLHEAAQIDGATKLQRFRYITLPMISPVLFFLLVIGMIGSFQVFTSAFVMTNGGPQNATLFAVLYIYVNGFHLFKMGYAAALAWLLFAIIMVFTFLQFRVANRWVYYEGKAPER